VFAGEEAWLDDDVAEDGRKLASCELGAEVSA